MKCTPSSFLFCLPPVPKTRRCTASLVENSAACASASCFVSTMYHVLCPGLLSQQPAAFHSRISILLRSLICCATQYHFPIILCSHILHHHFIATVVSGNADNSPLGMTWVGGLASRKVRDVDGCRCHMQVYPHGSTDALPFCTMGSGSLNAMAVFESGYKDDLSREEAVELVANAIKAGIYNDLGSGSNVDICVITKGKVDYLRNHEYLQSKTYQRRHPVAYGKGSTSTLTLLNHASLPSHLPCSHAHSHSVMHASRLSSVTPSILSSSVTVPQACLPFP